MRRIWRAILVVAIVAYLFSDLGTVLTLNGLAPAPSAVAIGIAIAAIPLVRRRTVRTLLGEPMARWAALYGLAAVVWLERAPFDVTGTVEHIFVMRIGAVLFLLTGIVVFSTPSAALLARRAIAVAVVAAAILTLYDALNPNCFYSGGYVSDWAGAMSGISLHAAGRGAGLYLNPNRAALAMVLGLSVSIDAVPRWARGPFVGIAAFGVFVTYSREGYAELLAAVGWIFGSGRISLRRSVLVGVSVLGIAAALASSEIRALQVNLEEGNVVSFENQERIVTVDDASASVRRDAAAKAWGLFLDEPILGSGLAATYTWDAPAPAHNEYLTLAAEYGIAGVLLMLGCLAALGWRDPKLRICAIVLAIGAMFSNNVLEDRYVLTVLALSASSL